MHILHVFDNHAKDFVMTIQAILFDKDGTLIDFKATFEPATGKVIDDLAKGNDEIKVQLAKAAGYDLEAHNLAKVSVVIAGSVEDIARVWAPFVDMEIGLFIKEIDELFMKYTSETIAPFEYLMPTLKMLKMRGILLGIATNDSEKGGKKHIEAVGASKYFSHIIGYDSGYGGKPEPGMVSAFAEMIGVDVGRIAMVGDSSHDMEAGKKAGAVTIAVKSGGDDPKLMENADYVLDSIADIPSLLDELN